MGDGQALTFFAQAVEVVLENFVHTKVGGTGRRVGSWRLRTHTGLQPSLEFGWESVAGDMDCPL